MNNNLVTSISVISVRNKWAVVKRNAKRASRLFSLKSDAIKYAKNTKAENIFLHKTDGTVDRRL